MSEDNVESALVKKPGLAWKAPFVAVIGLAAAGGLGYLSFTQYGQLKTTKGERDQLRLTQGSATAALDKERAEKTALATTAATCQDELTNAKKTLETDAAARVQLEATVTACQASVTDLAAEKAKAQAQVEEFRAVTEKFQKMIDAGDLDVKVRRGKMVVKLPDAIMFASGSAEMSETGAVAIAQVAGILKSLPDRRFTVGGHTDSVPVAPGGKFASNWYLSAARAVAVTELLIKMGIPAKNLMAAGYGDQDPIADNGTVAGRKQNRRIEIILEPDIAKLPVKEK
jgi:chemotaxis protein MotB